jgi:hypothetical protein
VGWRSIRFFRHVPVAPKDAHVLVSFENGTPLLFEQAIGSGRVLTLASPLDRDWNDLAIHPVFVRFVAEATAYLAGARAEAATAIVGSPVVADLARRGGGQVFDPDGRRASMLDGTAGGPRLVPEMPGFYEVRGGGRSDWIAVNADPRESDLQSMTVDSTDRWLALRAVPLSAQAREAGGQDVTRLLPIWFWLLIAAAILAFMEPLVANYHLHLLRERA